MVAPAVLSDQNKQAQKKDRGSWRVCDTLEPFNGFQPWLYFLMLQVIHVSTMAPPSLQTAQGQTKGKRSRSKLKREAAVEGNR